MVKSVRTWFRQIIPKDFQLSKFLDEYVKICNDLNKDLPPDCVYDDDSLDGRVTLSPKGIHYVQSLYVYVYRSGWSSWEEMGFEEDVLDTDLTQSFQPTEVLDISIPHIS
jgi:hypothetical protein